MLYDLHNRIEILLHQPWKRAWEYGYSRAQMYFLEHGDLEVPAAYVDEEGVTLGRWVRRHNEKQANGTTAVRLTDDRRQRLAEIGTFFY